MFPSSAQEELDNDRRLNEKVGERLYNLIKDIAFALPDEDIERDLGGGHFLESRRVIERILALLETEKIPLHIFIISMYDFLMICSLDRCRIHIAARKEFPLLDEIAKWVQEKEEQLKRRQEYSEDPLFPLKRILGGNGPIKPEKKSMLPS
jgi:hypothetical protein